MQLVEFGLTLSRHAFGPRERARAGHLWRLFQDAAIEGSSRRGWPPARYRELGSGFVVRRMTVVHHAEAVFGDAITARTWVSTFRRGMFSDREIRLSARAPGGEERPLASATQQWVYVTGAGLKPARAPDDMVESFDPGEREGDARPALPEPAQEEAGPSFRVELETWLTAMDPLAHANHPAYVDWADEALARWLAAGGHDPHGVVALGEEVVFRSGLVAPEPARVELSVVGPAGAGALVRGVIRGGDDRVCAEVLLHRTTIAGPGAVLGRER